MKQLSDDVMDRYRVTTWVFLALVIVPSGLTNEPLNDGPCYRLDVYVDCAKQQLKRVPDSLPNWTQDLDLSNNQLTTLERNSLRNLNNLKKLFLHRNEFTEMPVLNGLQNVTALYMNHNQVETISTEALEALPNLRELDLNNNEIKHVGSVFPVNCRLLSLHISENHITTIDPQAFQNANHLTHLKMNRNSVRTLPPSLFDPLGNLTILELNRNLLTQINGMTFLALTNLTELRLKRNKIGVMMDGAFWGLGKLRVLELDGNSLTKVGKGWLFGLSSLEHLTLSDNSITSVDGDGWESSPKLLELNLSNNRLTNITRNMFKHLTNLRKLHLKNNQIVAISDAAFNNTPNLLDLDLSGNNLFGLIEDVSVFVGLSHLTTLRLATNGIRSINRKIFHGLNELTLLDLRGNNVTIIQPESFVGLNNLKMLHMKSDSIVCDCNLKWFSDWIKSREIAADDIICGATSSARGKNVAQVNYVTLVCGISPKPRLVEEPQATTALLGCNATLRCSAASESPNALKIMWKHNNFYMLSDNIVTYKSPRHVNHVTSELTFVNVTDLDTGRYQCVVENAYGTVYSKKAFLSVMVFPTLIKKPENISIHVGKTAHLVCAARGTPTPQIAWQKDGGNDFPAARERRLHVVERDDVFFIVDAKPEDGGVYSCTASNPAGQIAVSAALTVIEPPGFRKPLESVEATAGTVAVLQCLTTGHPAPIMRWYRVEVMSGTTDRDGTSAVCLNDNCRTTDGSLSNVGFANWSNAKGTRRYFTVDQQMMIITNVQMHDAGTYRCSASNDGGEVNGTIILAVKPPLNSASSGFFAIIITCVVCAIATSIVWVIIIFLQTRPRVAARRHWTVCDMMRCRGRGGSPPPPPPPSPNHPPRIVVESQTTRGKPCGFRGFFRKVRFEDGLDLAEMAPCVTADCPASKV